MKQFLLCKENGCFKKKTPPMEIGQEVEKDELNFPQIQSDRNMNKVLETEQHPTKSKEPVEEPKVTLTRLWMFILSKPNLK